MIGYSRCRFGYHDDRKRSSRLGRTVSEEGDNKNHYLLTLTLLLYGMIYVCVNAHPGIQSSEQERANVLSVIGHHV